MIHKHRFPLLPESGSKTELNPLSVTENGTYTPEENTGYSVVTVDVPTSGGAAFNDVNFYDYDGTIVYSYSKSQFLAMSDMPKNPTHDGLISQGWNWTIEEAKEYVGNYGMLEIGQLYVTADGATRIYIDVFHESLRTIQTGFAVKGSAVVDWGDNSNDTFSGTSDSRLVTKTHTYKKTGNYTITITPDKESEVYFLGSRSSKYMSYTVDKPSSSSSDESRSTYGAMVKKIEFGKNIFLRDYAFAGLIELRAITVPSELDMNYSDLFSSAAIKHLTLYRSYTAHNTLPFLESISYGSKSYLQQNSQTPRLKRITAPKVYVPGSQMFYSCDSLETIILAKRYNNYANYQGSYSGLPRLKQIVFPSDVTELTSDGEARNTKCYSLTNIIIPANIKRIYTKYSGSSYSVFDLTCIKELKFESTTPPVVENSYVFKNPNSDCTILVPKGTLSAYKEATNYPSSDVCTYKEY